MFTKYLFYAIVIGIAFSAQSSEIKLSDEMKAIIDENVITLKGTGRCVKCTLYRDNLVGADLTRANLRGAKIKKANFSMSNLTLSEFDYLQLRNHR